MSTRGENRTETFAEENLRKHDWMKQTVDEERKGEKLKEEEKKKRTDTQEKKRVTCSLLSRGFPPYSRIHELPTTTLYRLGHERTEGRRNGGPPLPPKPPSHGLLDGPVPAKLLLLSTGLAAGGLYVLFQLNLLPKPLARCVSKVMFWPTLPFTMLRRTFNYWTQMDGETFLNS